MKERQEEIILSNGTRIMVSSDKLSDKTVSEIVNDIEITTVIGKYAKDEYQDEPDENGIYQPDEIKIAAKAVLKESEVAKKAKAKELNELLIDHNTVVYDANGEAIGNMSAVIGIASATWQRAVSVGVVLSKDADYNHALSVGIEVADRTVALVMSMEEAYKFVYKQKVTWKGNDNKPHNVQLESLVEASQKAMTEKAAILFKY